MRPFIALVLMTAACGTSTAIAIQDTGIDANLRDAGDASDIDSSCAWPYPSPVRPADKACVGTSECTVFVHILDCAQSLADIGVNEKALTALQDAEAAFLSVCTYKCARAPNWTVADDGTKGGGSSAGNWSVKASVRCLLDGGVGTCTTSFADASDGSDASGD